MKKVIISAVFFFLLLISPLFSANSVLALPANTYECVSVGPVARCTANVNTANCDSGYIPNEAACNTYHGDAVTCMNAGGACIPEPTPGAGGGGTSPTCNGGTGVDTAIGCIPFNTQSGLIGFILSWAIGIGGGVAFIMMLVAGFQIMTSTGNPDRLRAGQELLTSAIAGLILLVFSVFILRVIGIDILGIGSLGQ